MLCCTVLLQKNFASPEIDLKCHILQLWFYGPEIGQQLKKNYSKVQGNLIDIKIFPFAQIFYFYYGFYGDLTLSDSPDKHYDTGTVS